MEALKKTNILFPALAALLALLVFSGSLENDFVQGWDDELQVVKNQDIKSLDYYNVKKMFSTYYVGMYQPITTLSYALDYKISRLDAKAFHRTNLLFHLINIFLVFYLFYYFSGKVEVASIITFLFAVHPMNVESVAWISARSNLIYSAFFLAALISYVKFLKSAKPFLFLLTNLLFLLSVLSKATAVTLPFVLLLFDLWHKSKITKRDIFTKLPMMLVSIILVVVAFDARAEFSHLADLSKFFGAGERIVLVLYSVIFYLLAFVFPFRLSAIHYYPVPDQAGQGIGAAYYLGAALFFIIVFFTIALFVKALRQRRFDNPLLFGILFFALTISVTIHFVQIGIQLTAERYVYLPYLGLFYILAVYFNKTKEKANWKRLRPYLTVALVLIVAVFSFESHGRTKVWKDCNTLMSDVIKKNPSAVHAYLVRGDGFMHEKKYQKALNDYAVVISRFPDYESVWVNRANVYAGMGQFGKAISDLDKAIAINKQRPQSFFNRGLAKYNLKDYKGALADFSEAIRIDKDYEIAYLYRGVTYGITGEYPYAREDLERAVELNPKDEKALLNLGVVMMKTGDFAKAISFFTEAIKLDGRNANAFFNRALARLKTGDKAGACADFRRAQQLGNSLAAAYLAKFC